MFHVYDHLPLAADNDGLITRACGVYPSSTTAPSHVVQCLFGNCKQMRLQLAFLFTGVCLKNIVSI